ncbi:hypothetical protein FRC96_12215 [Lujinxingia vulgaris]|uniref:CRISPR type III-B/RAMP module-associated protein Cmr5 n=1 Tax=Lujinxingia vulgaris TaxID=2600176 RepID=A0A5C6X7V7_9DELT|nr:hypothetical protein [Lujinxingia vulgaris]TXD34817.1 hypothetical protein FRC96_12215 [Lujinxingia vulgaris]
MEILDMKCAELGQKLVANKAVKETLLTDVIGVLEEQGLYAAFLFLKSKKNKDGANEVYSKSFEFLRTTPTASPLVASKDGGSDALGPIKELSKDLDNLLLARELVRQALVYARYHAKAR